MGDAGAEPHWCASVVEAIVPRPSFSIPPPPPPPSYKPRVLAAPAVTQPAASSQYQLMYQQMYQGSAAVTAAPPVQPGPHASYASAIIQGPITGMSRSISAPWPGAYSFAAANGSLPMSMYPPPPPPPSAPPSYSHGVGLVPASSTFGVKKPNKSRFVAPQVTVDAMTMPGMSARAPPPSQPNSLKDYVKRAFASCNNLEERTYVSAELQKQVAKVTAEGRLQVHRWDLEAVPVYMSPQQLQQQQQRQQQQQQQYQQQATSNYASAQFQGTTNLGSYVNLGGQVNAERQGTQGGKKRKEPETIYGPSDKKRKSRFEDKDSRKVSSALTSDIFEGVDRLDTPEEAAMRLNRANRFKEAPTMTQRVKKVKKVVKQNSSGDFDPDSLKIVGICQKLEKEYLRLTQAPLPSVVRPEQVLRKTVQLIKKKWAEGVVDYVYMCSQLKSMRQDLTVQHIQNDFTVHVYETHARVALESDDMNEYNQCQTQLKHLYASGLKGSEMEFTAYRVLYYVYLRGNKKYTAGSSDLAHLMSTLKPEAMSDPAVAHALKIRQALQADNYHSFFQLYLKTPNMGTYILDLMVENLRATTLVKICKVYKPSVEADFVLKELAFTDKHIGLEFMQKVGCKIEKDRERWVWNTKDSVVDVSALVTETKLLL